MIPIQLMVATGNPWAPKVHAELLWVNNIVMSSLPKLHTDTNILWYLKEGLEVIAQRHQRYQVSLPFEHEAYLWSPLMEIRFRTVCDDTKVLFFYQDKPVTHEEMAKLVMGIFK